MPAVPKPLPRVLEKVRKLAQKKSAERECYAQVDRRDGHQCRVCRKHVGGVGLLEAAHHHHLVPRSLSKAQQWDTRNVLLLCRLCHAKEHACEIRLTGNADTRNSVGTLCGVLLERTTKSGWKVARWL